VKLVTKIGGSLFKDDLSQQKISAYAQVLRDVRRQGHQIVAVSGGGEIARRYIESARALGASEAQCDQMGIYVTRLNARLLISALNDDAFPEVPETVEELRKYFTMGKIVAMGGLQPAHSTDAVAAIVAESIKADLFVKTIDAPGVCTEDPKKHPGAKKLDEISVKKLLEMLQEQSLVAGAYELIDPVAVKVIARSKIPTWIVPGDDPANIRRALDRERVGTKIVP
jgi:uridylate kinase